ncbi:hypothetical protein [Shewanella litoralis]|nr:hypothetical protein [Shewanella litoralis]
MEPLLVPLGKGRVRIKCKQHDDNNGAEFTHESFVSCKAVALIVD